MLDMFFANFAVNENIIEINLNEIVKILKKSCLYNVDS